MADVVTRWPVDRVLCQGGKLKKANLATGSVKDVCDAGYGVGAAWARDGTILFAKRFNDALYRVPAAGW